MRILVYHLPVPHKSEPLPGENAHHQDSRPHKQDTQISNNDHHAFSFSPLTFCNTQVGFIHDLFRKHEISTPFHLEEINTSNQHPKHHQNMKCSPLSISGRDGSPLQRHTSLSRPTDTLHERSCPLTGHLNQACEFSHDHTLEATIFFVPVFFQTRILAPIP